jgi:hypothetical protein
MLWPWVILGGWALKQVVSGTRRRATFDSLEFEDALQRWSEVIRARHASPRAFKRFVDKVRFLASDSAQVSPGREPIDESALVALAVLYESDMGVVLDADRFQRAVATPAEAVAAPEEGRKIAAALAASLAEAKHPTEEDRRRFVAIVTRVANLGVPDDAPA